MAKLLLMLALLISNPSLASGKSISKPEPKKLKNYSDLFKLAKSEPKKNKVKRRKGYSDKDVIGSARYIAGGITSTFGFGLGQFVQGKGVKGISYLGADIGFSLLAISNAMGYRQPSDGSSIGATIGVTGLIASRIFQIFDAWAQPTNVEGGYLVENISLKPDSIKLSYELPLVTYNF